MASWGHLAAAGVVVNDLRGEGLIHVGEEHLRVAVCGHTAVHHHEGTLHSLPPPGMVFLQGQREGKKHRVGVNCSTPPSGREQALPTYTLVVSGHRTERATESAEGA